MSILKGQPIKIVQIRLSNTDIQSLNSSPITVIPNPGPHKAIDVISCDAQLKFGTSPFSSANIYVIFAGYSALSTDYQFIFSNLLNATGDLSLKGLPLDVATAMAGDSTMEEGKEILLVADSDSGSGDSVVVVNIAYRIVESR